MKTVDLIQGTPEWHAHRARHFNASDAPAMMGCSPYTTRAALLRTLHTGLAAEVDASTQSRFDDGHRFEAFARPIGEGILEDDLYPCTGTEGRYSASFDGLTLDGSRWWEHKSLNDSLRAVLPAAGIGGPEVGASLPLHNRIQLEHQAMVCGGERALFTASRWTNDGQLVEARHCWYEPDLELRAQIVAGWQQLERDLEGYEPPAAAAPAATGRAPEALPALRIEVTGAVTASNLAEFKATALGAIRSVNRELRTDQDFADADKAVKWCGEVESRLKLAKDAALAQTSDIEALFRALDEISKEARDVRLDLEKLVKRRKDEVREQAVTNARKALEAHIATLHAELAPLRLLPVAVDFAGAIKGLRSIASMQDALDTTLANAKIAADAQARLIRGNVAAFKAATGDDRALQALFADLGQLVHKAADDFAAVLDQRITKHRADKAAEDARRQAEEAERIAAAERLAAAAAEARVRAEQETLARREREAAESDRLRIERESQARAADILQKLPEAVQAGAIEPDRAERIGGLVASLAAESVISTAKAAANEPATLKLGTICDRLGVTVTAAFLADSLGIRPAKTDGRAALFTEAQFQTICAELQSHISAMAVLYGQQRAA